MVFVCFKHHPALVRRRRSLPLEKLYRNSQFYFWGVAIITFFVYYCHFHLASLFINFIKMPFLFIVKLTKKKIQFYNFYKTYWIKFFKEK